ncbi:MAG: hypothetical protein GKR90_10620 [Pseudomonadales bacterium]|nr:hypothetical protein [Pseudomonadales bacterium]
MDHGSYHARVVGMVLIGEGRGFSARTDIGGLHATATGEVGFCLAY